MEETKKIESFYDLNAWKESHKLAIKEKINFYAIALGSLTETQNQLLISRDVSYISSDMFKTIWNQTITVSKLCNGLIKKMKTFNHNT